MENQIRDVVSRSFASAGKVVRFYWEEACAFKRMGLGPLIGKRTRGGLIGISANPSLIDGGNLVVPFFRFFTPEREWRVENEGVAPNIEVELDPTEANRGRDPQLDASLKSVMERLQSEKQITRKVAPAMPTQLGK